MLRLALIALLILWPSVAQAAAVVGFVTAAAAFLASPLGQVVSLAVVTGTRYLLAKHAQRNAQAREAPSAQIPERAAIIPKRLIYGEYCVAGGVFYQKSTFESTGDNNNVLVFGYLLSEGLCDALSSVVINGVECDLDSNGLPDTAPWNTGGDYIQVSFRSGTDGQNRDPIITQLFAESDEFRQRGIATAVVKMLYGTDQDHHVELWGNAAEPQLLFKVRGRVIYDPRDSAQDEADPETWLWSDNATLCQVDYLRHRMGFALQYDDFDWDSVIASANWDDTLIEKEDGTFEKRGRINGVVQSIESNADVLDSMRLANRAKIQKIGALWTWTIQDGGAPVATISKRQLIGSLTFQNRLDARSRINTVQSVFYPASKFNARAETQYQSAAALAEDGQERIASVNDRFVDSPSAAQRNGFADVTENREGRLLSGMFDISVIVADGKPSQFLAPEDAIHFEWDEDHFSEITGDYLLNLMEINFDFTVSLTMVGYSPEAITGWSPALEIEFEGGA